MYAAPHGFIPADEACGEELPERTAALRRFMAIDPGCGRVPDDTMLLKFRCVLPRRALRAALLAPINAQ